MNIFEYSNIFNYFKTIKSKRTATYQSKDCAYDIKNIM